MTTIVVGGGAAGMLAAAEAAKYGQTLLLEKGEKLGKKIYITGKGRCNVTNDCTQQDFMLNVPRNPKFLYSAIHALPPQALMEIVTRNGTELKTERGNRVFPVSDKSSDIIKALKTNLERAGVQVQYHATVTKLLSDQGQICGVQVGTKTLPCDRVILATGGISYAQTGSDGSGFNLAKSLGHTVITPRPALVPLNTSDEYLPDLQGLSLKNVALCANLGKKKLFNQQGEMLFTHFGLSGPLVLTLSSTLEEEQLKQAGVYIDLKPALTLKQLDNRLIRDFSKNPQKRLKNSLTELAPSSLQPVLVKLSGVDGDKRVDQLSRPERQKLAETFKHFPVHVTGFRGFNEAIITRGGISVKEVHSSTMESKLVKGLFFSGEMLDVDAFTGGFNLQVAFCTGYLAGNAVES